MYEHYYGLKTKPFDLVPDPRFLYLSRKHDVALTHLEYGIIENKGFIVLTGDVGTGKTTLLNLFLGKVKEKTNTAVIFNTNLDPQSFLELVVREYGITVPDNKRSTLLEQLYDFILREYVEGKRTILVVDEAQNLPAETLEELRMLSNFETEENYLLQIILSGQPQLKRRLQQPELLQLTQRISVHYHLTPLPREDIGEYIRHRVATAGYSDPAPLFTEEAIDKIFEYTGGVPRLISAVCDMALVYGYADDIKPVNGEVLEKVFQDREIRCPFENPAPPENSPGNGPLTSQAGALEGILKELAVLNERLLEMEKRIDGLSKLQIS